MGYIGRSGNGLWHYASEVQGLTKCGNDGKAWVEWAQPDARPEIEPEEVCSRQCREFIVPWQPALFVICSWCGRRMESIESERHYHVRENGW